jgi:hypothetical protein
MAGLAAYATAMNSSGNHRCFNLSPIPLHGVDIVFQLNSVIGMKLASGNEMLQIFECVWLRQIWRQMGRVGPQ